MAVSKRKFFPLFLIVFLLTAMSLTDNIYAETFGYSNSGTDSIVQGTDVVPYGLTKEEAKKTLNKIGGGKGYGVDVEGVDYIKQKVMNFVKIVSGLILGLAVIMISFAGFKYATSEGDSKKMRDAKMQIIMAGVGIGVSIFNFVIVKMFEAILNVGG